jgi:hypothetical protein
MISSVKLSNHLEHGMRTKRIISAMVHVSDRVKVKARSLAQDGGKEIENLRWKMTQSRRVAAKKARRAMLTLIATRKQEVCITQAIDAARIFTPSPSLNLGVLAALWAVKKQVTESLFRRPDEAPRIVKSIGL